MLKLLKMLKMFNKTFITPFELINVYSSVLTFEKSNGLKAYCPINKCKNMLHSKNYK